MKIQYKIINIIILYIIFNLTYYVLFPYRGTVAIFYVVCMLFSTANYFVSIFRNGNSILPGELLALRTALNVSGSYIIEFTWELWKWLGIGFIMILISMKVSGLLKKEKRIKSRLFMGILTFAAIIGISKIQLREAPFKVIPDYWQPKTSYYTYGTPLTFLALCQNMKIEKPEGYDQAIAKEIYQEIEVENEKAKNSEGMPVKPTVIAIMNESLSDLGIIRKFNSDPDYLEFLHSFEEPEIQGNLLVPVYSGGTCNTEFEFLTGMSMGNFPKGVFPYQQYNLTTIPSLAREFKAQGYDTLAIHPGEETSWNRKNALLDLGFDRFIGKDEFRNPEYIRYFISDKSCYERLIEEFENKERETFIFCVTIQNHGSYDYLLFPDDEMVQLDDELNSYIDAKEYMSLVKKSDEALKNLIEYFKQVDEPVVICVFGDHQPGLNEKFYEALYGKNMATLTIEEQALKYTTPYFIWSNYGLDQSVRSDTSSNYLGAILLNEIGVPVDAFFSFLLHMEEAVPQFSANFCKTKDGVMHSLNDKESHMEIEQYRILQYYEMFDSK